MRLTQTLTLLVALATLVGAGEETPFTFPRSSPEAQGISSAAILGFVEAAEQKINALHSFMLVRHGQVVAEGWWAPYAAGRAAHAVLAEQELHVDGRRAGDRRGQAERRRSGAEVLPGRRAGPAEREPAGDARARPADDVDRAPRRGHPRLSLHRGGERRREGSSRSPSRTSRARSSSTTRRRPTCCRPSCRR